MNVVGMMTVRDEEDILEESGSAAAVSYDTVLAVDCGSQDGTPRILKSLARRFDNIVFLGSVEPMTSMQVKRHIWSAFRRRMSRNDWWVFADADEFVDRDTMRSVLSYALSRHDDKVYGEHVNFYYTEKDYEKWQAGEETLASRTTSIAERRKYYRYHTHQLRCFRNLPWLRWNSDTAFPENLSSLCERRIPFRHYQYRDVPQIERRIRIRRSELHRTHASNTHWKKDKLEDAISNSGEAHLLLHRGGPFVKDPRLPELSRQGAVKSRLKYLRNMARGYLTARDEADWFSVPSLD